MKAKILYISPSSGLGGAETFLKHVSSLHSEEYAPIFACFSEGPLTEFLKNNSNVVYIASSRPRLSNPISFWRTIQWLVSIVRKEEIQLIHSTMAYGALYGAFTSLLNRVPHVWFQHGPIGSWIDKLASFLPAQLIYVNSNYTKAAQQKLAIGKQLQLIHLGVDRVKSEYIERRGKVRESIEQDFSPVETDRFISTMICRPQPQKGVELWLTALSLLRKKNIPVSGLLIGGDGNDNSSTRFPFEKLAAELKVPFVWKRGSSDAWRMASAADVLVCASVSPEGYGLTIAEAMAYEVCAIAPDEGGPLDLISHNINGLLFKARNAESLADAHEKIWKDRALKIELIRNAKKTFDETLKADIAIQQIEKSYRSMLRKEC